MGRMVKKEDIVIVGGGITSYAAAIYTARADLKPVLYQGLQPGGQLTITTEVENFPGYPEGISGTAMMEELKKQAEKFDTDVRWGLITSVDFCVRPFKLIVDENKTILADTVIIATGASAKWLGMESEERLNGFGVSGNGHAIMARVYFFGLSGQRLSFCFLGVFFPFPVNGNVF